MNEIEEIPLETTEGTRPRSNAGDRLVVGLAALALLGGLLIAGANLLGSLSDGQVASSSGAPGSSAAASVAATPRPSRTPRPSPTPRPLRDLTVEPADLPDPVPESYGQAMGWLEIVAPSRLFAAPDVGAEVLEELPAGTLLVGYPDGPQGWYQVVSQFETSQSGWLPLADDDGVELAIFHVVDDQLYAGWVRGVWSSPQGLVAIVDPPHTQYTSVEAMYLQSLDGERWRVIVPAAPVFSQMSLVPAWGPEGWVAAGMSPVDSTPWIWQSYDGESWEALGKLPTLGSGWPMQMVGSGIGYLLAYQENVGSGVTVTYLFSRDGISWQEGPDPFGRSDAERMAGDELRMLAGDGGFLAWTVTSYYTGAATRIAFSPDGLRWQPLAIEGGRVPDGLQLAVAGDSILGVSQSPSGAVRAWRARLSDGGAMQLVRDAEAEAGFSGTMLPSLASNGVDAYALGFGSAGYETRLWRSDGGGWQTMPLPERNALGYSVSIGAIGPRGLVLIGSRTNSAGDNPVFWHLRDDGGWFREADPVIPLAPDPTVDDCGPLPATALQFALVPPTWGAICFGDQPMTFTAWSAPCDWCNDGPSNTTGSWLMDAPIDLLLRPIEGDPWPYREAVLHPSLQLATDLSGVWVRLTGHFADPAAADCAWPRDPSAGYIGPTAAAFNYCSQRFVVTELSVVDGPDG